MRFRWACITLCAAQFWGCGNPQPVLTGVEPSQAYSDTDVQITLTGDNFLPHFTCAAVGETLATFMRRFPKHKMLVLCGHTHSPGTARILPNLLVRTGGAAYGRPGVVDVIDTGSVGADERSAGS